MSTSLDALEFPLLARILHSARGVFPFALTADGDGSVDRRQTGQFLVGLNKLDL
jgi:hypothetical protein